LTWGGGVQDKLMSTMLLFTINLINKKYKNVIVRALSAFIFYFLLFLFIQDISIAPPQVNYYSGALPTQHG